MVQRRIGSGDTVGIMVRVPEGLRDRVRAGAEASGRSMNAEIVATLEKEYPAPRRDVPLGVLLEAIGQVKRLSMKQSAGTASPDDDLALLELYRKLADLAPDMTLEEYERLFSIALEASDPDNPGS